MKQNRVGHVPEKNKCVLKLYDLNIQIVFLFLLITKGKD